RVGTGARGGRVGPAGGDGAIGGGGGTAAGGGAIGGGGAAGEDGAGGAAGGDGAPDMGGCGAPTADPPPGARQLLVGEGRRSAGSKVRPTASRPDTTRPSKAASRAA